MTKKKAVARRPQRTPLQGQSTAATYGENRPLNRWEISFANWWSQQTKRVPVAEQIQVGTALNGGAPISYKRLKALKLRPSFVDFVT